MLKQNKFVITASDDCSVKYWDLSTETAKPPEAFRTLKASGRLLRIVNYKNKYLIGAARDNKITVWDLMEGTEVKVITEHSSEVWGLAIYDDYLFSCAWDNKIISFDILKDFEKISEFEEESYLYGLDVSKRRRKLVTTGYINAVRLFDIKEDGRLQVVANAEMKLPKEAFNVKISHNEEMVVACCDNGEVHIFDLNNYSCIWSSRIHNNSAWNACFDRTSGHLFSVSYDTILQVVTLQQQEGTSKLSGTVQHSLKGHTKNTYCVTNWDEDHILTGSDDMTFILWNWKTGKLVKQSPEDELDNGVYCILVVDFSQGDALQKKLLGLLRRQCSFQDVKVHF